MNLLSFTAYVALPLTKEGFAVIFHNGSPSELDEKYAAYIATFKDNKDAKMTEKLIPVQLPLKPEKAHLYRLRNGQKIKSIKPYKGGNLYYVWDVCHENDGEYLYTAEGKFYNNDEESPDDITHEVAEEAAECGGCKDDINDLLKTTIDYLDGHQDDSEFREYLKKNYPKQWSKYSDECNQSPADIEPGAIVEFIYDSKRMVGTLIAKRLKNNGEWGFDEAVVESSGEIKKYYIIKPEALTRVITWK